MNYSDRKIPRVSILFQQRSNYEAHLRNLSEIRNRAKAKSGTTIRKYDSCDLIRQRHLIQSKKCQINQSKIYHQNRRLGSNLRYIKGIINSKNLERDYSRALQIKQRLIRYSTDHKQRRVILKAQKLLEYAQNRSEIITSRVQIQKKVAFPQIIKQKSLKKQQILITQQPRAQLIRQSRKQKVKQKLQPKGKNTQTKDGGLHTLLQNRRSNNKQSSHTFCTDINIHTES